MGLTKEGSRGKLGKWMSFGCDEFGIHGEELADSADDHSCSNPNHGGRRKKKVNTGVREIGLELREWMRMCRTPGRLKKGGHRRLRRRFW